MVFCSDVGMSKQEIRLKKLKLEEESDSDISEMKDTVQRVQNMKTTILFTVTLMKDQYIFNCTYFTTF